MNSISFDRRPRNGLSHSRMPVEAHEGTYRHFLFRHEKEARDVVQQGPEGRLEIGSKLLKRIADPRNVRVAIDRVIENEGTTGPDGLDCADLTDSEKWQLARTIKQCLLNGDYRHGPIRKVKISKVSGNGTRTIHVEIQVDRIIGRAILQIIQPLIDPQFSENSFGFRPGKDRRHALQAALEQLEAGRSCWAIADLEKAFDHVPVSRLLDVLRKMLPGIDDQTIELIRRVVKTKRKRGIRQGSPLSPVMLNVYLHHLLDRVWTKLCPDEPLLRTADDILICCRTAERAHAALDRLRQILRPTGMRLNEKKSETRNLNTESGVDWLGYLISGDRDKPCVQIAESAWTALAAGLEEAHHKPGSPIRAYESLWGWLDQLGPCYSRELVHDTYLRARTTAERLAFDELPDEDDFRLRWRSAHARWRRLLLSLSSQDTDGGSACHSFSSATGVRRSDGASSDAPSQLFPPDALITLHTDGAYDSLTSSGGWAAILEAKGVPQSFRGSGFLRRATNNRAELIAAIKGLEKTSNAARVQIVTDSKYLQDGINDGLAKWKSQGWRAGNRRKKRPLQNVDLWRRLDDLLADRDVTCTWVRGHSGHRRNEECDRMASEAMATRFSSS